MILLPPRLVRVLTSRAERAAPDEACAALLGCWDGRLARVQQLAPLRNTSPHPKRSFLVDPLELLALGEPLGVWHSHPRSPALPSAADRAAATLWPDLLWLISGSDGLRAWQLGLGHRPRALAVVHSAPS